MILIVEDDLAMRESLEAALELAGYDFISARDGRRALAVIESAEPDLILLDLMLPGTDGLSVLQTLRRRGLETPIMLITARDAISDRVQGLDAGADDYLPKPFVLEELLARVRALLRRSQVKNGTEEIRVADLVIHPAERRVSRAGREVELTKVEFNIMLCLARNAGIVVSRDTLWEEIWGGADDPASNTLEVHISYLRNKIAVDGDRGLIRTVRGVGYVLRES